MKTRRFGPLVILLAATVGVGGEAWAKPPPDAAAGNAEPSADHLKDARKHYSDGEKKYKAGDYAGAYADFQAADNIKPAPQTARYMGLCQDALGHHRDAVAYFDRFLGDVPARIAAEKDDAKKKKLQDEADEIQKREDEIKKMPGKIHVESVPSGARVTVDGKPAPGPTPTDVDVAPGTHTVNVSAEGRQPAEKQVDVAFASTQNVNAELEATQAELPAVPVPTELPPPAPVAPAPPPPQPRSMLPAYITGGVAIVAAGIGTVFGVMALSDKSNFDSNPTSQTADDGENHALIADMCFGVALTLGVTSAVLFLTPDEASAPAPAAGSARARPRHKVTIIPTPIITPNGGGAGALVRF